MWFFFKKTGFPFRWTKAVKIRILQLVFFVVSIMGILTLSFQWTLLGLFSYVFLETVAGNIALHRYFAHKSFETYTFIEPIFRFLSHYIGLGSVVSWVATHRYHHKHSDTVKDAHSPHHQGIFKIIFGLWNLNIERKMIRDILQDKKLLKWHRHYFKFHIFIIGLFISIDFIFKSHFFYSLYALPNLLCLLSGYVLVVITHSHGYQTYPTGDESRNSWIANIYTLGEGWHNNHHAQPDNYQSGELAHEWDLPALLIRWLFLKKEKGFLADSPLSEGDEKSVINLGKVK